MLLEKIPPLALLGRNDMSGGGSVLSAQLVFETWHGDESSPLHCVVPFIRTGYNRSAPGTAHRPFPTVSLVGVFFNQSIPKTDTSVTPITVNCQLKPIVNCQFFQNVTVIRVPRPSWLSRVMRAPWIWAMCLTMARPRPVPPVSRERLLSTR